MFGKSPAVYGTVVGVLENGSLQIHLEDGRSGIVPFEEITRQTNLRREGLDRLVGWKMGCIEGEGSSEGLMLSGKAFEEREYLRIRDDFAQMKRNVYSGRLVSITTDGKLAFYKLAQGVTGALHVSAFCLCRIYSFKEIDLPRELTVVISGIDSRGWISLSAKPAFGDFDESVRRLELSEGNSAIGRVSGIMADGAASIMLAPNLTLLTDVACRVYPGDRVRLRIRRIDHALHRIKAQMLERIDGETSRFRYQDWNRPAESMEAYIDLQAFDERIRLNRPHVEKPIQQGSELAEPDFTISAARSPFSTYQNEQIIREPHRQARVQDIYFEARMGYLSEKHMKVASAVEALKYSSAWQVRRYLFLREKLIFSERELKNLIDRLVKHDIIGVLRFHSDEGTLLTRVLHPSINYRAFCGRNPRNFGPKDFIENRASSVKMRLSANQLLIGLLHSAQDVELVDTHPFLKDEDSPARIRPRHMLVFESGVRYLESVRKGWEDEFIEKLGRYDMMPADSKQRIGVIAVLEDKIQVEAMSGRINELHLNIPVWLTDDLSCLPEPVLTEIPASARDGFPSAKAFLQRIRQKIEDMT